MNTRYSCSSKDNDTQKLCISLTYILFLLQFLVNEKSNKSYPYVVLTTKSLSMRIVMVIIISFSITIISIYITSETTK